ncbi:hypothetical protein [Streptomyces sp. 1222.5]|uniref:hypothetical protein n=1 Tax=Streptomyces sp. 1222.5 TaxID=1881026 RepID=UPI003EBF92C7
MSLDAGHFKMHNAHTAELALAAWGIAVEGKPRVGLHTADHALLIISAGASWSAPRSRSPEGPETEGARLRKVPAKISKDDQEAVRVLASGCFDTIDGK